jgi:hypothetical protein
MAHCHRELYHTQWAIILDDELLDAYVHGIMIDCCDGIRLRFYPHIPLIIVYILSNTWILPLKYAVESSWPVYGTLVAVHSAVSTHVQYFLKTFCTCYANIAHASINFTLGAF